MLKILTLYYCHWYVVLGTLFERYSTVLEKAVLAFSSRIVSYTHLTWQRTLSQFNPVYRSMGRFRNPNWRCLPCMYVCAHTHTYIYIYTHTYIYIYIYTVYKAYVRAKFQGLCPENMPAICYSTYGTSISWVLQFPLEHLDPCHHTPGSNAKGSIGMYNH